MRLKKIEVLGFKSFADRQLVVVDDHVTGVIGPNGCGKSNIVDAIRWCMGEQSAKHLRGTGMADVIFAGCTTRGAAGMAEVTITFDNEHAVTIAAAPRPEVHFDHPEIALTRRLYADGTSEYLINRVPARLRDITELLMGTGAGTKGYSIIEQGQVGRIVSSKAEERRHIIDEAAGITRFKTQKAAAERKIEATRQNLARVGDVVAELEERLSVLRRQAQKAERYKRYREELRDLDLWAASHRYLELASTGAVLKQRHGELSVQTGELTTTLTAQEEQAEALRTASIEVERELSERQQRGYDLDNRIRLLAAETDYRTRERTGLVQSGTQAEAEADAARRNLAQLEAEQAEVARERALLEASTEGHGEGSEGGHEGAVRGLEAASREVERALTEVRRRMEGVRAERGKATHTIARAEARRQSLEEALASGEAQVQALQAELLGLAQRKATLEGAADEGQRELSAAEAELVRLRSARTELDRKRVVLREQVSSAEVALDTRRAEVHRHRSRLQSLEEIERRYRSCNSGVQVVMAHQEELAAVVHEASGMAHAGPGGTPGPVYGILADYLHTPEQLETAVSAVLGDRLEGVVVDAPAVGARGVELLKREQEGRTTFVPRRARDLEPAFPLGSRLMAEGTVLGWADPAASGLAEGPFEVLDLSRKGAGAGASMPGGGELDPDPELDEETLLEQPGVIGRLEELVEVKGDLAPLRESLLGGVIVIDSLHRALELWEERRVRSTLVTLDGDRIEPTGVVIGGSPTALNSALLQQKREIRELQEILVQLDQDFAAARGRHQALAHELHDAEGERERSEGAVLEAEKTVVRTRAGLERSLAERDRVTRELGQRTQNAAALEAGLTHKRQDLEAQVTLLHTSEADLDVHDRALAEAEGRLAELGPERERLHERLTEAKVALARWQQQRDTLTATRDRLARQCESERQRIRRLDETAANARRRVVELEQASALAAEERERLVADAHAATLAVHESRERFEALRLAQGELEVSMRTLRRDLDELRQKLVQAGLGLQETHLEREHLLADCVERLDVDVTEVLIDYHGRPVLSEVETARQKELKTILARMGEVNLTAIAEFEDVSQRYEYLTKQKGDLETGLLALEEAIDRINKTTRDLFKQTFDAVNERFQMLFPRLFGGGEASLKMTDPNDLLATGVEIEARPPGKQPRTLDLLSGGEKALTAVSLIFAIFLIKPSPFCLLDEVDAPLDDANVARFCNLVRELAGQTQFIIITHNKVTMETADRLYGVTMEQRGVSKLVSVNLRRAVEMVN